MSHRFHQYYKQSEFWKTQLPPANSSHWTPNTFSLLFYPCNCTFFHWHLSVPEARENQDIYKQSHQSQMVSIASAKEAEDSTEYHSASAIKMQWRLKDHKSQMITSAKIVGDSRREYGHQSQMIASASTDEEAGDSRTKRKGTFLWRQSIMCQALNWFVFCLYAHIHVHIYIYTHTRKSVNKHGISNMARSALKNWESYTHCQIKRNQTAEVETAHTARVRRHS